MRYTRPVVTWIFGYGSLIWRPSFPFEERRTALLRGFSRRFYQGSHDHRGTPEAPGRVVTLLEDPSASCLGVAYRISPQHLPAVLDHLDVREQNGYERLERPLALDPPRGPTITALVYLAGPSNPAYLGPAPLAQIADQVRSAHGPSGPNIEYLLRLADALRELEAHDEHVFQLEALVRSS
ncbi:MAG: gamma-glutamylcyclotransferase [Polyangiaceae bacterium]|nr:gamma-glutamylcyclotransferase [Polyangiaceae bacterium]